MKKHLQERLALALNSDDLKLIKDHCDLDKIICSGWASRKHALGCVAFWAKYAVNKRSITVLTNMAQRVCVSQSRRKHRGGSRLLLQQISTAAVCYWLNDTCPACHGRGYHVDYDKQTATQHECQTCHGTRLRTYPSAAQCAIDIEQERFERIFTDLILAIDQALQDYVRASLYTLR